MFPADEGIQYQVGLVMRLQRKEMMAVGLCSERVPVVLVGGVVSEARNYSTQTLGGASPGTPSCLFALGPIGCSASDHLLDSSMYRSADVLRGTKTLEAAAILVGGILRSWDFVGSLTWGLSCKLQCT